ncbi:MAG: DUF790 family protein [Acidobacteria bacterium]|nr:DUF790 family protein [Acidobacteriota bacterium]
MLPSELLTYRVRGGQAYPQFLNGPRTKWATSVLETITGCLQKPRSVVMEALKTLEGNSPDYRLVRGLAHLALEDAVFSVVSPIPPEELRQEAFTLAAEHGHRPREVQNILNELANRFGLDPEMLREAFYADLPENHMLVSVPDQTPEQLIDRYNLAQAQGLLYYARQIVIQAHRNVPGEYRKLFHLIKFYGLMYAVEGNLDDGYRVFVDGPASLFRQNLKYGVKMAAFFPALLHITRWEIEAELKIKGVPATYHVTSQAALRSHYPKPPAYDSLLEASFVERWVRHDTLWTLEREVEIVDLKGTVMVPDFALRHPSGQVFHVEIVGFWHPDYLRRKFDKVRRAGMKNLILAVSDRLKVTDEHLAGVVGPVIFFKGKLLPKAVLDVVEELVDAENSVEKEAGQGNP